RIVIGEQRRQIGAERDARGAGQRGEIQQQRRVLAIRLGQRIAQNEPPFRVLTISKGRIALPATEFSTAGTSTRSRTLSLAAMIACARPSIVAAPPMSFFISFMPLDGFRSSPPVSKHTPLPTSVTFGALGSPQRMS